jgi:hypothetical protein
MRRSSTASNRYVEAWIILAVAALLTVFFYLLLSVLTLGVGFPLDDSWIHLTYARNLAEHGEWAFRLGERSAGSTAPLWTALLSIGFLIGLAPYVWTYLVGWVVLTLLAVCAENIVRKLLPSYKSHVPWAGLFFVFAWHLTWSDHPGGAGRAHDRFAPLSDSGLADRIKRLGPPGWFNPAGPHSVCGVALRENMASAP